MSRLYIYDKELLLAEVDYDFATQNVVLQSYTDNPLVAPFGIVTQPTWDQFMTFLKSRCVPRTRGNIKAILQRLEISHYDPFLIIHKTHGIIFGDKLWIRFENEDLTYEQDIAPIYSM